MPRTHDFPTDQVHFTWDTGHEPVLTVGHGDTVVFETRDVSDDQLEKGRSLPAPQYRTAPGSLTRRVDHGGWYGTTGVGGDLYTCAQDATRAMIEHLTSSYGLSPEDAYLLCSLVVDLKISEIVDAGVYIVSALLPDAIFTS